MRDQEAGGGVRRSWWRKREQARGEGQGGSGGRGGGKDMEK